jgi:hypothetical protein
MRSVVSLFFFFFLLAWFVWIGLITLRGSKAKRGRLGRSLCSVVLDFLIFFWHWGFPLKRYIDRGFSSSRV